VAKRIRLSRQCCRQSERAGRDPATLPMSLMTPFVFDRNHARRFVKRVPSAGPAHELYDRLASRGVAGTPSELAASLREFEAAGVDRVMLQHVLHEELDVVAAIGRELAPAAAD
jgi:alkanesulfonate monooxygenase SsuD/methylene tetrahydromethanopterin reductase-like flavin-dependent oxidoreductase (luciferase family)